MHPSISSWLWMCRVYNISLPAVWTCTGYPFHNHQHQQYGCAGCITFHYLQFVRVLGIPFTITNTSGMDVQGVSISTASSTDMHGVMLSEASSGDVQSVSISTTSRMDLQGVSLSTGSSMDVHCAGCLPSTPNIMDVLGVSISTASSIDVQGISLSITSSMYVQCVSISTASSMDLQGVPLFEMPECRTVRHPVSPVLEWTKILMPEPVPYRNATVPDWDTWCRKADADSIYADGDANLCYYGSLCVQLMLQLPFHQSANVLLNRVSDLWPSVFSEYSDFMAYKWHSEHQRERRDTLEFCSCMPSIFEWWSCKKCKF